jgi:predicted nucleotidyltransferase
MCSPKTSQHSGFVLKLAEIAKKISGVHGVCAIVLGGSRARGAARTDSDFDVGIYYDRELDVEGIRRVATEIALARTTPVVTEPYTWGRWVNGGAWIDTSGGRVDFLYRNLVDVRRVLEQSQRGEYEHDFDQQPSFGFRSYNYLAELRCCAPLADSERIIEKLKESCWEYPAALRRRVINDSLFSAEFSIYHLKTFIGQREAWNASAAKARIVFYLLHALFALNREYWFGDKGAIDRAEQFQFVPDDLQTRLTALFADPFEGREGIERLILETRELIERGGVQANDKSQIADRKST